MNHRPPPPLARLALGIALALSALSARAQDPRCPEGMASVRGRCEFSIRGEVQRPLSFDVSTRREPRWQPIPPPPASGRRAVVDATRATPF
jgi:hypothetical protein